MVYSKLSMKKVLVYLVLLSLFLVISIATYKYFLDFVPIKFSSKHPNISISKNTSRLFDIYSSLISEVGYKNILGVKPKLVGIIYTDKTRSDNKELFDGDQHGLGATIDKANRDEILIYIYISENVIKNKNTESIIRDYTIDTMRFYQRQKKSVLIDLSSKLVKLPINVKTN